MPAWHDGRVAAFRLPICAAVPPALPHAAIFRTGRMTDALPALASAPQSIACLGMTDALPVPRLPFRLAVVGRGSPAIIIIIIIILHLFIFAFVFIIILMAWL